MVTPARLFFLFIGAVAASALGACTALDRDAYNRALDVAVAIDEGSDLGFDAGSDIVDVPRMDLVDVRPDVVDVIPDVPMCDPFRVPPRPPKLADVDAGARPPLVFVMQRVQFGLSTATLWGTHGFDRDGLCTNPAIPGTMGGIPCRPRSGSAAVVDGDRGRDNAFAAALGSALSFAPMRFDEDRANMTAASGESSIGVRITDYAGTDDGSVTVEWFPLMHGHRPGNTSATPMFDGMDVWHINRAIAYDTTGRAAVRSEDAFVNNGQLVMRMIRGSPVRLANMMNTIRLTITGGRLVGALAPDGSSFGPTEFSGLWPLAEALVDIGTLGLCPPPPAERALSWNFALNALNAAADLRVSEEVAPATLCDAISIGFGIVWVPATLDPMDESTGVVNETPCAGDGGTADARADTRAD